MRASVILVNPLIVSSWFLRSDSQTKLDVVTWYLPSISGKELSVSLQLDGKTTLPGCVKTFEGNLQTTSKDLASTSLKVSRAGFNSCA